MHLTDAPTLRQRLTADSDDLPPSLYGYAAMHLAMRRDADRLTRTLAATPRDPEALQRWWQGLRDVIERHHQREDDLVWPALAAADPTFADDIATMHDDHDELDAAMAAVDAALAAVAWSPDTRGHAYRAAATFATVLTDHLAREEDVAFHRLAQLPEMWAAVEHEIERGLRIGHAAYEVPWVYEGAAPARLAHLQSRVPRPFRPVIRFVWQPRYRRLVAKAHATAVTA